MKIVCGFINNINKTDSNNKLRLKKVAAGKIQKMIDNGANYFICSFNGDCDLFILELLLFFKIRYSELTLILILPHTTACKRQSKSIYQYVFSKFDKILYLYETDLDKFRDGSNSLIFLISA